MYNQISPETRAEMHFVNDRLRTKLEFFSELFSYCKYLDLSFNRKFINRENLKVIEDDSYQITDKERKVVLYDNLNIRKLYIVIRTMYDSKIYSNEN